MTAQKKQELKIIFSEAKHILQHTDIMKRFDFPLKTDTVETNRHFQWL